MENPWSSQNGGYGQILPETIRMPRIPDMANAAAIQGYGVRKIGKIPKRRVHNAKHPGFQKVAQKIARKEHLPIDRARAILAASSRKRLGGIVTLYWPDGSIKSDCFGSYPRGSKMPGSKKKPAKPGTLAELLEKQYSTNRLQGGGKKKRGRGFDGEYDAVAPIDRTMWNSQRRSRVNTGHTSLSNTGFY